MSVQPGQPIDFEAEGLLDGLDGPHREERLALLEKLAGLGVPLADLRRTTATGTVMYLAADRVILGTERYTAAEVAELSGVDEEFLVRARRLGHELVLIPKASVPERVDFILRELRPTY